MSPKQTKISAWTIDGPPEETKPDYENIHGPLGPQIDKFFLKLFRRKLAENVGFDSSLPQNSYKGIMELATALNSRYSDRTKVQTVAKSTLSKSLGYSKLDT